MKRTEIEEIEAHIDRSHHITGDEIVCQVVATEDGLFHMQMGLRVWREMVAGIEAIFKKREGEKIAVMTICEDGKITFHSRPFEKTN